MLQLEPLCVLHRRRNGPYEDTAELQAAAGDVHRPDQSGPDTAGVRSFASHEKAELVEALWDFAERIEGMGPSPAKPRQELEAS